MKKYPKITVVTPSFNQGQFIETTIQSVLGQEYPNLEYIICDGGSTDGTVDILKKYDDKIAWWCSEKDKRYLQWQSSIPIIQIQTSQMATRLRLIRREPLSTSLIL